ncbi:MAG TPA: hypothetical protein LFW21_00165 [Rickettsia endosymbiont of Pyrocoelia pectoralis]|nr:hypothetical protein [Rickettsia endosymbiont of Pyrocoelia pectoralis]
MFSLTGSGSLTINDPNLLGGLLLNNANTCGTIDLNNNCEKILSDWQIIHQGITYTTYTPKTNSSTIEADAEIKVKNPQKVMNSIVSIVKIAANLQSTTIEEFKKYQQEDKKILNFLSGTNNLSNESKEIDTYINKNYFKFTGVAKHVSILPNEILMDVCSYLNLDDVKPLELAGESSDAANE